MIADIDINSVGTAAGSVTAIVAAIALVFRLFGNYILKPYSKAQEKKDDDRLDAKLKPIEDELRRVGAELTFNGGSTTKDAVRRTERRMDRLEAKFEEHDRFTRGHEGN